MKIVKLDSFENEAFNFQLISFFSRFLRISLYLIHLPLPLSTLFSCSFRSHLVELYPRFFHHRCFLRPLSPRRPEIRLGTVRFKVDIPHHPGFLLKLAANASRRLKLITGGVGEAPREGGLEMDEKGKRGDLVGEELCYTCM